jgi:hypothetical protein
VSIVPAATQGLTRLSLSSPTMWERLVRRRRMMRRVCVGTLVHKSNQSDNERPGREEDAASVYWYTGTQ